MFEAVASKAAILALAAQGRSRFMEMARGIGTITPKMLSALPYAARNYMGNWVGPDDVAFQAAAMTAHMESLAMLILSGRYLGYLPVHFAEAWVQKGRMRRLLAEQMSYVDTFYLAHLASERNRAMATLFDCVRDQIGRERLPRY